MLALAPILFVAAFVVAVLVAALAVGRVLDMQAVVVRERVTGRVIDIYVGPRWYFHAPGLDEIRTLDLHFHRTTLEGQSVQTSEGLSASVTVTVGWQQTGARLEEVDLREVLPFLADTEDIVRSWILFTVRAALSRKSLGSLLATMTDPEPFETRLKNELQRRVGVLGVEVLNLNLICLQPPAIVAAQGRAEELKLTAQAEAEKVRLLSGALPAGRAGDNVVAVLNAEALRSGNKNVIASINLGGNAARNGRPAPTPFVMPIYDDQEPFGGY